MTPFIAETIGTCLLILLGNGVVANVVLNKTYGNSGGWIVITFGWAMGVFVGVYATRLYCRANARSHAGKFFGVVTLPQTL